MDVPDSEVTASVPAAALRRIALRASRRRIVMTPWGDSDTLRERKLRPGPGVPRIDIRQSQRERLYGAMVASTAERGYEATGIPDLLRISGVSRDTFDA